MSEYEENKAAAAEDAVPARKRPRPGERRLQILQTLAAMLEAPGAERVTTAGLAATPAQAIPMAMVTSPCPSLSKKAQTSSSSPAVGVPSPPSSAHLPARWSSPPPMPHSQTWSKTNPATQ